MSLKTTHKFISLFAILSVLVSFDVHAQEKSQVILKPFRSFCRQVDVTYEGRANSEYVISKRINLKGKTVTLPKNCSLIFKGGRLKNGELTLDNTIIEADGIVMKGVSLKGTLRNENVDLQWFAPVENKSVSGLLSWVVGNESVKEISLPKGRFYIDTPVMLKSGLTLKGLGTKTVLVADRSYVQNYPNKFVMFSTVKQISTIQTKPFQYEKESDYRYNYHDINIKDLCFDLNYAGGDNKGGQMATIKIEDARNVTISNCCFVDDTAESDNHTYHAVYIIKSKDCYVKNCQTENISFVHIISSENITCSGNAGKSSIGTWLESNDGHNITYENNNLDGVMSMTSAISFNSKECLAKNNNITTKTPIVCGIVLGHPNTELIDNSADGCIVQSNSFEILGNGKNDNGVLVQNGEGIKVIDNKVRSSGNTIRVGQNGQATIENNELILANVANSNLYLNTQKGVLVKGNKITDTGEGVPADYNLVVYLVGDATIEGNTIESNVRDSKYNLIWAAPKGNVKKLSIKDNSFDRISIMGHVRNLSITHNNFTNIKGHLFSNSVNVQGITEKIEISNNKVFWENVGSSDRLVYLTGEVDKNFNVVTDVQVYNNEVNAKDDKLIRVNFNEGKINLILPQK